MVDGFITIAPCTLTYRCPFSAIRAVAESVDRVDLDPLRSRLNSCRAVRVKRKGKVG